MYSSQLEFSSRTPAGMFGLVEDQLPLLHEEAIASLIAAILLDWMYFVGVRFIELPPVPDKPLMCNASFKKIGSSPRRQYLFQVEVVSELLRNGIIPPSMIRLSALDVVNKYSFRLDGTALDIVDPKLYVRPRTSYSDVAI